MKKSLVGLVQMVLALSVAGSASAANESVSIETGMSPFGGKLYKELRMPVQSRLEAEVTVPDGQPLVLPMKQARIRYDRDMTFNPNNRKTPVCPESSINPQTNLAMGVSFMTDRCSRSVVGTGTSLIYVAKQTAAPLLDPQMVIFNAGRNGKGEAKIKIYAYSKNTATGILMYGTLSRSGLMVVDIPVLSFDSAVGHFRFDIPGNGMEVEDQREPDGLRTIKGLDRQYVKARCSDGAWTTNASFRMGERNPSNGADTSPTTTIQAPAFTDQCRGLAGRPNLKRKRKVFPRRARRGSRPLFRVTVVNRGTATARKVRLVGRGGIRGERRVGNIPPRSSRSFWIRPRVIARKGNRARAVVRVVARGSSVGFASRIRVR